jgi:Glycosyl transferase family 90
MAAFSGWDGRRAWDLAEAGRLSDLSDLIDRSFGAVCRIRVEVDDGALQPVARWEIIGQSESCIVVGRRVGGQRRVNLHQRSFDTLPLIAAYHREGTPATGSVALSLEDWGLTPGLAFCDRRPGYFLIPDPLFISSAGYDQTRRAYASNDVPWSERLPVALWRGHDFGPSVQDWRDLPRVRLCAMANEESHRSLFDVGISPHRRSLVFQEIRTSGLMRDVVPVHHFNRFRYHIDIDGRTNSWPGLFQKLLSGSPVLKITSAGGYRQWYYDRLRPWENFVPVAADMSDLFEKADWLVRNDEAARAIGAAGKNLADSMTFEKELRGAFGTIAEAFAEHARLLSSDGQ